jgi:hypothetical protein
MATRDSRTDHLVVDDKLRVGAPRRRYYRQPTVRAAAVRRHPRSSADDDDIRTAGAAGEPRGDRPGVVAGAGQGCSGSAWVAFNPFGGLGPFTDPEVKRGRGELSSEPILACRWVGAAASTAESACGGRNRVARA